MYIKVHSFDRIECEKFVGYLRNTHNTNTQSAHLMTGNDQMNIRKACNWTTFLRLIFLLGWNKDFKPAPYPETEEERRAAAKKYGLLPEEYKPYPPDCK